MGELLVAQQPADQINSTSPVIVNDNMDVNTIDVEWIPKLYYIFIGSIVCVFTIANALKHLLFRQRILNLPCAKDSDTARPENRFWQLVARLAAIARNIYDASLQPLRVGKHDIFYPTVGKILLIVANFIFVIALCFYRLPANQYAQFQNIGYRCGFVALPQLTMIFALATRNNIIGWLIGLSYERLNYLHRWFARTLLVTVTLHMAYWMANWAPYEYIGVMIQTDPTTQRGLAAWLILLWTVFSSFTPIRGWNYELFVFQHLISYLAFMTAVFLHTPSTDHEWLWTPVAIWGVDILYRCARIVCINLALLHPAKRKIGVFSKTWACKAKLTALPGSVTRVTIFNPPLTWTPGQHATILCQYIALLQNHPFTIASNPRDGKLEFFVRAQKGATQRISQYADRNAALPRTGHPPIGATVPFTIGGPYGKLRPLRQFDTVVFLTGGTGATFTVPLLRDLVYEWRVDAGLAPADARPGFLNCLKVPRGAVTRHIRFIWAVKSQAQLTWFADQLRELLEQMEHLRCAHTTASISVEMSFYVTRDPNCTHTTPATAVAEPTHQIESPSVKPGEASIAVEEVSCCELDDAESPMENAEKPGEVSPHGGRETSPQIHPSITILHGRPHPQSIIREALDQARGETAVVACGPKGLINDSRKAARQGGWSRRVWFWGEGFSY